MMINEGWDGGKKIANKPPPREGDVIYCGSGAPVPIGNKNESRRKTKINYVQDAGHERF